MHGVSNINIKVIRFGRIDEIDPVPAGAYQSLLNSIVVEKDLLHISYHSNLIRVPVILTPYTIILQNSAFW